MVMPSIVSAPRGAIVPEPGHFLPEPALCSRIRISWGFYFRMGVVMTLPVLFVSLTVLALRLSL